MISTVSEDTQAVMLLTCQLGVGVHQGKPATPTEYNRIARALQGLGMRPADLVKQNSSNKAIAAASAVIGAARTEKLLARTLLLATKISRWQSLNIWAVSRADDQYPLLLRKRMGAKAPALLFGIGPPLLHVNPGLGIVGSRKIDEEGADYAEQIGRLAASADLSVISGAARGVDRQAMYGCLDQGGSAVGVVSDSLEKEATHSGHRQFIQDDRLTIVSQFEPSQRFSVGVAMERNKVIYALSLCALVVESDLGKGGTWAGAKEQLKTLHYCEVFVRATERMSPGRAGLVKLGASVWTATSPADLQGLIAKAAVKDRALAPSDPSSSTEQLSFEGDWKNS